MTHHNTTNARRDKPSALKEAYHAKRVLEQEQWNETHRAMAAATGKPERIEAMERIIERRSKDIQ